MTNLYFFHLHACYSIFQNFFCAGIQFFVVLNSYNGLTFTIIILYKIVKDVMVEEICDLSIEECLKAIKDDILILEMMRANDDYSKELFRRYDLINQYINSKKS